MWCRQGLLSVTFILDLSQSIPVKCSSPFDFCLTSLGCFGLCCFILYPSKPPPCRRHCGTAASYWSTRVIVHCPGCRQRSHWSAVLCCTPSSHNLPHCTLLCTHLHFITLDHIWSIPTVGVESAVSVSFRFTLSSICWFKAALLPPWLAPLAGAGPADLVVLCLKVNGRSV